MTNDSSEEPYRTARIWGGSPDVAAGEQMCSDARRKRSARCRESPPNLGEAADQCSVSQLPSALDLNCSIRYRTFFQAAYRRGIPRRLRIMSHYDNRLFELPV